MQNWPLLRPPSPVGTAVFCCSVEAVVVVVVVVEDVVQAVVAVVDCCCWGLVGLGLSLPSALESYLK